MAHRAHLDSSVDMIKHNILGNGNGPVRDEGSALVDNWECLKFMVKKSFFHFNYHDLLADFFYPLLSY